MAMVALGICMCGACMPECYLSSLQVCHTTALVCCFAQPAAALAPAGAQMAFTPPCSSTCQYKLSDGRLCCSELLLIPKCPGKSVAITMMEMTSMPRLRLVDVLKALFTKPGQVAGLTKRSAIH